MSGRLPGVVPAFIMGLWRSAGDGVAPDKHGAELGSRSHENSRVCSL